MFNMTSRKIVSNILLIEQSTNGTEFLWKIDEFSGFKDEDDDLSILHFW